MSNEELFRQVENLLERKLTQEECKFLAVAGETLKPDKKLPYQTVKINARIA